MGAPKLGEEKLIFKDAARRDAMKARLHDLYVVQNLGTVEMAPLLGVATHKSVLRALHHYGIPVRPVGKSRYKHCMEPDCYLPLHKIRHKTNGAWYGRRCRLHWIIFRMEVNQRYNDKHLGKDDEAWLRRMRQLLARVRRLNREVSQSLKRASAPGTTSPAACPR
jgi:hypothetical protein